MTQVIFYIVSVAYPDNSGIRHESFVLSMNVIAGMFSTWEERGAIRIDLTELPPLVKRSPFNYQKIMPLT
jgi:hypothetical protein